MYIFIRLFVIPLHLVHYMYTYVCVYMYTYMIFIIPLYYYAVHEFISYLL